MRGSNLWSLTLKLFSLGLRRINKLNDEYVSLLSSASADCELVDIDASYVHYSSVRCKLCILKKARSDIFEGVAAR